MATNASLLHAAVAGDEMAFDALIGPLVEPAFRLAASILQNQHDADDVVQEATINAWRNLDRLQDPAAVRSWFLTIVANQCRSVRRGRWWTVVKLPDPHRMMPGPEDAVLQRSDLERGLRSLAAEDRLALFLRYYLDLPLTEVATILEISETAAKSRIHRAAQRLRPSVELAGEQLSG